MGVRILADERHAAFYCSTSDWAFGPVFYEHDGRDPAERAEAFLRWHRAQGWSDPRQATDRDLERRYSEWLAQEAEQYAREEQEA